MGLTSKHWTKNEVDFLIEYFPSNGASFCSEKLNKTLEAIRNKASRLGLKYNESCLNLRYNRPANIPTGYIYCFRCKQILPESNFYRRKIAKRSSHLCRSCSRTNAMRSYRKNKSSNLARLHQNPRQVIINRLKTRTKKNNIPFNLTIDDIRIPEFCPILGIPIILFSKSDNSPSIDRIIPKLGYIKGNIIIISNKANRIKNDASFDELKLVSDFYNNQKYKNFI